MTPQDPLLSTRDAAKVLGTSESFLANDRVTRRHGVPYLKYGKLVRYRLSDLEKWLESRAHDNPQAA